MANTPEGRIKIVAENLARVALAEMKRDVAGAGTAAAGASTGFGKMVFAQGNLIASTANARRGVNILENGFRTLAFEAVGASGPVGKIATGFGLLGAGSLVVTGAVAGVGAVALGYQFLTSETTKASAAIDAWAKGLSKATTPGEQFTALLTDIQKAEAGLTTGLRGFALTTLGQRGLGFFVEEFLQSQRESLEESAFGGGVAALGAQAIAHQKLIDALQQEGDLIGLTVEQAARYRAELGKLTPIETADYVARALRIERRKEENRVLEAQKDLLQELADIYRDVEAFTTSRAVTDPWSGATHTLNPFAMDEVNRLKRPDIFADEAARQASLQVSAIEKQGGEFAFGLDQDFFNRAQADVNAALGEGGKSAGLIMAQSFVLALPGLMQGGAAGIFGGLGGLATAATELEGVAGTALAGPLGWAGLGLSALGTILGSSGDAERRHRELLEETRRIRQNTDTRQRPQNVGVHVYVDGQEITDRVMYELGRATRRDATPRLPPR